MRRVRPYFIRLQGGDYLTGNSSPHSVVYRGDLRSLRSFQFWQTVA